MTARPALAPIPLTVEELAASMAAILLLKEAPLHDSAECAVILMESRFLDAELLECLDKAIEIAQESREANRRRLFDIVNIGGGQ